MIVPPMYPETVYNKLPITIENMEARNVEEKIAQLWKSPDSIVLNWRLCLKNVVRNLAVDCATDGWDGDDAIPITELAVKAAEHFIDLLPENILLPTIVPENTGEFLFNWDLGMDMTFNVIVSGAYVIYAGIFGEEKPYGEARIYTEMPDLIRNILSKYFEK